MSKLSPLKPAQVIKKLRKLGFVGPYPGGRHVRMVHPKTGKIIPIPMHKGKDVGVGLIRAIIREVGITPDEWNRL
ncbi:MAG: type II toxin-antitoxin system HicA family toxin [Chloroflexi bacterium]|nr:type II toxin-antitoxin system HicA family toxin [Chloroflexota bacterium]